MRSFRPTQVLAVVGLSSLVAAVLYPLLAGRGTDCGYRNTCLSNVKRQAIGLIMYASDFDDRLVPSASWMDATYPYGNDWSVYHCPAVQAGSWGYAFDRALSGQKLSEGPSELPTVYDSTNLSKNATDLVSSFPKPRRHHSPGDPTNRNNVAYADGHARSLETP